MNAARRDTRSAPGLAGIGIFFTPYMCAAPHLVLTALLAVCVVLYVAARYHAYKYFVKGEELNRAPPRRNQSWSKSGLG